MEEVVNRFQDIIDLFNWCIKTLQVGCNINGDLTRVLVTLSIACCGCSGADGICNREGKLLKKPGPPSPPASIRLCRAWYGGGEVYLCCCLAVRDWCPKG
ncbi:hypothetical protein WA026_011282 [Henosepilachna vigintioctopunctata]|uniref:Uncharacterized protein n=1 Tax=Henosepilachna vigintioctopunctata TaxID=420089 RepID=A0AAW1U8B8_9CUCU